METSTLLNGRRRIARRLLTLVSTIALALAPMHAFAQASRCVDAAGKTSAQSQPCPSAAETTPKAQPPPGASARPPTTAPATTPAATSVDGKARGTRDRIPSHAEFKGPRETWERLRQALRRGDKEAALRELTTSAQQRLGSTFDTVGSKSPPFNVEEYGSIRSVTLAAKGLATMTLTHKKGDGTYVREVMLIRDADGKWRIENM